MLDPQALHRRAVRVLPEAVHTAGVWHAPADQAALSALLFPLRRAPCGSMSFQLSASTVEAMAQDPLRYLQRATQARQGLGRRQAPNRYRPWRCARIPARLVPFVQQPGAGVAQPDRAGESWLACFTTSTDGKALLLVVPEARLAVYAWNDRATSSFPVQEFLDCLG